MRRGAHSCGRRVCLAHPTDAREYRECCARSVRCNSTPSACWLDRTSLVAYARLGAIGRQRIEKAYWTHEPQAATSFEYWSHAACLLPAEDWPHFAFRRRRNRGREWKYHKPEQWAMDEVLARLRDEGPLTATELGGAKAGGEWWDWSAIKVACERLLAFGDVVVTERRGWRRVYDLPQRALPAALLSEPDDRTCLRALVRNAVEQLGVATVADIADQYRLVQAQVHSVIGETDLVEVSVESWRSRAWADPAALTALGQRARHRTTLLSPFDSLVWDRTRTERVFDFTHRLEAYTPAHKRVHGYFAMPLLAGGQLVGRVDPKRIGKTLVARQTSLAHPRHAPALARSMAEAANWLGCDSVRIERLEPAAARGNVEQALSDEGLV